MIALITTIADHGAGAALAFSAGALLLSAVGIIAMLVEDKLSQRRQERVAGEGSAKEYLRTLDGRR
jgi:hypothetical protein